MLWMHSRIVRFLRHSMVKYVCACTSLSTSFNVSEKIIKFPFLLFKIWLLLVPNVNLNQIQWNPTFLVSQLYCCTHGRKNWYNYSILVPENDKMPTYHLSKLILFKKNGSIALEKTENSTFLWFPTDPCHPWAWNLVREFHMFLVHE